METKNTVLITSVLMLAVGLGIGYVAGTSTPTSEPSAATHEMPDGSMMQGVMNMSMDDMTASLDGKKGDALDVAFIDAMIVHHEGAIDMAEVLLAGTKRPELVKLGNDIISAQTKEIEMMSEWRTKWFGR